MPMKKVILIATLAATPALAGNLDNPWDRPTLTPPVTPPTLTVRKCGEDFERITGWFWLRVKTGEVYTLNQRKFFESRKCSKVKEKPKERKKLIPIGTYFKPREPKKEVEEKPKECRRVEREGQTPRFVEVCE